MKGGGEGKSQHMWLIAVMSQLLLVLFLSKTEPEAGVLQLSAQFSVAAVTLTRVWTNSLRCLAEL